MRSTAISPGGRYVGIATVDGTVLERAEVHALRRHRDPAQKFAAFLTLLREVLDEDQPAQVVVEALRPACATPIAKAQALRVADEASARGIGLQVLDPRRCQQLLVEGAGIKALRTALTGRYPELRAAVGDPDAQPSSDGRRARHLLAAVALGIAADQKIGATAGAPHPDVCTPSDPPAGTPA